MVRISPKWTKSISVLQSGIHYSTSAFESFVRKTLGVKEKMTEQEPTKVGKWTVSNNDSSFSWKIDEKTFHSDLAKTLSETISKFEKMAKLNEIDESDIKAAKQWLSQIWDDVQSKESEESAQPLKVPILWIELDHAVLFSVLEASSKKTMFLVKHLDTGKIELQDNFEDGDITYVPMEDHFTKIYCFSKNDSMKPVEISELIDELREVWNDYIDNKTEYKNLNIAYTLLTYSYLKMSSLPYLGFFGIAGSGKTHREVLHEQLDFYGFRGVSIPSADVFQFVNDYKGTYIEDQYVDKSDDLDKHKILDSGYQKGAKVPRIATKLDGTRRVIFMDTFGPKILAGIYAPSKASELGQRIIDERTFTATPKIYKFKNEDFLRFSRIRNKLLLWAIQNWERPLPEIKTDFVNRDAELFDPILQVVHGTELFEPLKGFFAKDVKDRLEAKQESLDSKMSQALLKCLEFQKSLTIPFDTIRVRLAEILDGTIEFDAKSRAIGIEIADEILYDKKIINSLKFSFNSKPKKGHAGTRTWKIDPERLIGNCQSYGIAIPESAQAILKSGGSEAVKAVTGNEPIAEKGEISSVSSTEYPLKTDPLSSLLQPPQPLQPPKRSESWDDLLGVSES
ncbi:MAG: hypothetical protein M1368_06735 [Thaumarchaeota archaeon]|nr:hypothetical protein [Nitrososphaerota archaeon]